MMEKRQRGSVKGRHRSVEWGLECVKERWRGFKRVFKGDEKALQCDRYMLKGDLKVVKREDGALKGDGVC